MKNRVLGLSVMGALAVASMGPAARAPSSQVNVAGASGQSQEGTKNLAEEVAKIRREHSGFGYGYSEPRYPTPGWSCAEAKRRKIRRRNKLRSKGQFRKAVR